MRSLLKIDFKKYFFSKTFWTLGLMYLSLIFMILFAAEWFLNNLVTEASTQGAMQIPNFSLYEFPLIWHNLTFLGGLDLIKLIMSLIVIIFITREFTFRTMRQNVMNGLSRTQFLLSKVLFIFNLSLFATLIIFLSGTILGLKNSPQVSVSLFFEYFHFLPAYMLEMFTFCAMCLMIAFLVKGPILSVAVLMIYYIGELIMSYTLPEALSPYLPFVSMRNIIDTPNSSLMKLFSINFREYISIPDTITCVIYSVVFIGIVYLVLRKRDL